MAAPAIPGAEEVLQALRERGHRLALISASPTAWAASFLARHGWAEFFEVVVSGEEVAQGKPDPACYRLGLERMDAEPAKVAAVEDSPNGVAAAKSAGIGVIGFALAGNGPGLTGAGADRLVTRLADVPPALADLP
jgi:HAD superfamily hydrolase (TIGR01509 family)